MNPETWQFLSSAFGIISICTWLCAQLPQIVENYRRKSVDGLSFGFLAIWISGDLSGLIGCVVTGQQRFQTVLSTYYVCTDLVLLAQYWFYSRQPEVLEGVVEPADNSNRRGHGGFRGRLSSVVKAGWAMSAAGVASASGVEPDSATVLATGGASDTLVATTASFSAPHVPHAYYALGTAAHAAYRVSIAADAPSHAALTFGYACAYTSTVMYMTSRLPQIYHNMQRRSVEGVSPLLFCATLFGNCMYTASIVCASFTAPDQRAFLMKELSYILGSAGTVLFDVLIFLQFYLYRRQSPSEMIYQSLLNKHVMTHQYASVSSDSASRW